MPSTWAVVPTTGECLGAAELLGEQRADGDAARHADTTEDLRADEGPNHLALQGRPVELGWSEDHGRLRRDGAT